MRELWEAQMIMTPWLRRCVVLTVSVHTQLTHTLDVLERGLAVGRKGLRVPALTRVALLPVHPHPGRTGGLAEGEAVGLLPH